MSGIYIKGMQMPIRHNEATFAIDADGHPTLLVCTEKRPEPEIYDVILINDHGDLIDRDKLLEGEGRYFVSAFKEAICIEEVERAPAVIPADTND